MEKDYKNHLLKIAKQMILIHDVNLLAKLIIRTLTRTLHIKTAGLFICNKDSNEYIIKVSNGKKGSRIPVGFAKIKETNPIIKFFLDKQIFNFQKDYLSGKTLLKLKESLKEDKDKIAFLQELEAEMSLYDAELIIPGFFREDLLVVFFISPKDDGSFFSKEDLEFLTVLSSDVVMAIQNAQLFEKITKQLDINKRLILNTVEALVTAIDKKNTYTHGHSEKVMKYSMIISKYIPQNLVENFNDFKNKLQISALLHDIGKIGIPETILDKETRLSDAEIDCIREHPVMGAEILEPIEEFKEIALGVRYHHERFDGAGYPYRLSGDNIPLTAAIISVADAYDAMLGDRPYRKGLQKDIAIEEIIVNRGKQFNPVVVDAFLKAVSNEEL